MNSIPSTKSVLVDPSKSDVLDTKSKKSDIVKSANELVSKLADFNASPTTERQDVLEKLRDGFIAKRVATAIEVESTRAYVIQTLLPEILTMNKNQKLRLLESLSAIGHEDMLTLLGGANKGKGGGFNINIGGGLNASQPNNDPKSVNAPNPNADLSNLKGVGGLVDAISHIMKHLNSKDTTIIEATPVN